MASLDGLVSLRRLDLSDTQITTLPPLDDLVALQELNLANSNVADLPSVRKLPALKVLNLGGTGITSPPAAAVPAALPVGFGADIPPPEVPPVAVPLTGRRRLLACARASGWLVAAAPRCLSSWLLAPLCRGLGRRRSLTGRPSHPEHARRSRRVRRRPVLW